MGLLELPKELRDEIYSYVLDERKTISVLCRASIANREARVPGPSLSMVCRQLRQDCLLIFYSNNTFEIDLYNGKVLPTICHWIESTNGSLKHLRLSRLPKNSNSDGFLAISIHVDRSRRLALETSRRDPNNVFNKDGCTVWVSQDTTQEMEAVVQTLQYGFESGGDGAFMVAELERLMKDFIRVCRRAKTQV